MLSFRFLNLKTWPSAAFTKSKLRPAEPYGSLIPGPPKYALRYPEYPLLGGSWDLVSTVISTLSGVISSYKFSYLNYN